MSYLPKIATKVLFFLLVTSLGYTMFQAWKTERLHAKQMEELASRYADELVARQHAEIEVSRIDQKYRGELNVQMAENSRLSSELERGGRVRIITREVNAPSATSAACVGDGTSFQLPGDTGRNVLRIRAGIIQDQAKIKVLQSYIQLLRTNAAGANSCLPVPASADPS